MHTASKLLAAAWAGVLATVAGHYAGVSALSPYATAILTYGTLTSPLPVLGGVTALYGLVALAASSSRKKVLNAQVLRDKPGLVNDPPALARERRRLRQQLELQRREAKVLRRQNKAGRRVRHQVKKETKFARKRDAIEARRMQLRRRQGIGP